MERHAPSTPRPSMDADKKKRSAVPAWFPKRLPFSWNSSPPKKYPRSGSSEATETSLLIEPDPAYQNTTVRPAKMKGDILPWSTPSYVSGSSKLIAILLVGCSMITSTVRTLYDVV